MVTTKIGSLVIGVDVEGRKHALGFWIADTEGAKFWAKSSPISATGASGTS